MIAVIDYGMGNLRSIEKGLKKADADCRIVSSADEIKTAAKVVLPGVGAFGDGMKELEARGLTAPIREAIKSGKPFLGVCLGLQLLFEESEEAPGVKGLGILKGKVKGFKNASRFTLHASRLKVPHMGWNQLRIEYPQSRLLRDVPDDSYMYFVHSYFVEPEDKGVVGAWTEYGGKFASVIFKDKVYGTQFHPEKSQELGLKILDTFVNRC